MTNTQSDDENLLDRVEGVVDAVLGEDLPRPEEDPWERRGRILDSWTALLMAIAAVATTWASFQASQWSDVRQDAQSASALHRTDATRAAAEATSQQVVDSQMWLSWLAAVGNRQPARAEFFEQRFSPALATAHQAWLGDSSVNDDGIPTPVPEGRPMDLDAYVVPGQVDAANAAAAAEASIATADEAGANSTGFVLLAVVFALSLFFLSIATKFSAPRVQVGLILTGALLLGYGVLRSLFLPHAL